MENRSQIIICGAGIAGISAAYFLMHTHGIRDIVLIDERPPLSLTSDKSTECYRNWWPGPDGAMTGLMNRSIQLLLELANQSQNIFQLNQRGYLYATARSQHATDMLQEAEQISALGAGPLRIHPNNLAAYPPLAAEGYSPDLDGADWIANPELIQKHFPYLRRDTQAVLHVRRAGWFSAQQLGMYMLNCCRQLGLILVSDRVTGIQQAGGRVTGITLASGRPVSCESLVIAGGPYSPELADYLGIQLPLINELHLKASIRDPLGVIPRDAPLIIWKDQQWINWTADELDLLSADPETEYLTKEMHSGCHTRPEGGAGSQMILLLWEYKTQAFKTPVFPPKFDEFYPEIALRGMSTAIPGLAQYIGKTTRPWIDGGYYTRTPENRPLVTPLQVSGTFLSGGFSGFGLMAACAAGELLASQVTGQGLPVYAPAFDLQRYQDPTYMAMIRTITGTGQL
jgi:glycine/D-amino acid oxidase-like deaminating enzyme